MHNIACACCMMLLSMNMMRIICFLTILGFLLYLLLQHTILVVVLCITASKYKPMAQYMIHKTLHTAMLDALIVKADDEQ